jgi:hypothetical protein
MSDYYDTLIAQVENVSTCSQLADINAEITDIFTVNLADIQASIDLLEPLLEVPSADLGAIITWITSVIDSYTVPTIKLNALLIATLAKQVEATTAISDKFTELGC